MYDQFHDRGLFRRFDGIRIAWPFFLPRLTFRERSDARPRKTAPCLTQTEILDLFADEFHRHTSPHLKAAKGRSLHRRTSRPEPLSA